jgi:type IV pilus assembly protein PilE
MLITVVIIGILTMIALPNYTEYVRQGYRNDARTVLLEAAQFMERFNTVNGRYDQDTAGNAIVLSAGLAQSPRDGGTRRYVIAIAARDATTYSLTATPDAADDCGTYMLDNTGLRRNRVGGVVRSDLIDRCWNR